VGHLAEIRAASFSPDGRLVLTASRDGIAKLSRTSDGATVGQAMRQQGSIDGVAFSPDGRLILSAGADRTARLWSGYDGTPIGPPLIHPNPVKVVGFSPDGSMILTGMKGQVIRYWKAPAPIAGDARRVVLWIELLTGMTVGEAYETRLLDAEEWQNRRQLLTELDRTGVVRVPDAPAWDEHLRSGVSAGVVPTPKPESRDATGADKPPDQVLEGDRESDWTQHSFDGRTRMLLCAILVALCVLLMVRLVLAVSRSRK
jgi:hypothetical protein